MANCARYSSHKMMTVSRLPLLQVPTMRKRVIMVILEWVLTNLCETVITIMVLQKDLTEDEVAKERLYFQLAMT